mgnify:CR=1 FL=1
MKFVNSIYCLDVKPEPQEEPIEVDKLAGFEFLNSLNYSKELIAKAYAANDSMLSFSSFLGLYSVFLYKVESRHPTMYTRIFT